MVNRKKAIDIAKTVVLVLGLIFFVVIAVCQIYELNNKKPLDDRIVLGVNGSGNENFGRALNGRAVPIGNLTGLVSGGNFMVIDSKGDIKTEGSFMLSDPILHSRGNYCIVADYGGNTARLYEKGEMVTEIETEEKIISVTTNQNGFFAIATEETGYNAVINVYRKNGTAIYRYRITENIFVDMDISSNNRKLIITEASISKAEAGSVVVCVELNMADEQSSIDIPADLYMNIHYNKNSSFVALSSEKVDLYRSDLKQSGTVDFDGRSLIAADITVDDMICLAFEAQGEGAASVLEIYDKNGKMRGSCNFQDEITSLSVIGGYVAVSHGDAVDIVKSSGKVKKTFVTTSPVKYATPFSSGEAAVILSGGNTIIMH